MVLFHFYFEDDDVSATADIRMFTPNHLKRRKGKKYIRREFSEDPCPMTGVLSTSTSTSKVLMYNQRV